jgi:hypothetical protein
VLEKYILAQNFSGFYYLGGNYDAKTALRAATIAEFGLEKRGGRRQEQEAGPTMTVFLSCLLLLLPAPCRFTTGPSA